MTVYIVGLGNPGDDYENTRHNAGRNAVSFFQKKYKFSDWTTDKSRKSSSQSKSSKGKIGKKEVVLIRPEVFMNKSGLAIEGLVNPKKALESLVVVHDDLDIPIGKARISFNRGSGGHRGVESIIRLLKTKAFTRLRIGISRATPKGVVKKVQGEKAVCDFILGKFRKDELIILQKTYKKISEILESIISDGREKAMNKFNQ